jgi:hypothetical protein
MSAHAFSGAPLSRVRAGSIPCRYGNMGALEAIDDRSIARRAFARVMLLAVTSSLVRCTDRVALVIGNGAYRHANPCSICPTTPPISRQRRAIGFDVVEGRDLESARQPRSSNSASSTAPTSPPSTPHGLQVGGKNYSCRRREGRTGRRAGFETVEVSQSAGRWKRQAGEPSSSSTLCRTTRSRALLAAAWQRVTFNQRGQGLARHPGRRHHIAYDAARQRRPRRRRPQQPVHGRCSGTSPRPVSRSAR